MVSCPSISCSWSVNIVPIHPPPSEIGVFYSSLLSAVQNLLQIITKLLQKQHKIGLYFVLILSCFEP